MLTDEFCSPGHFVRYTFSVIADRLQPCHQLLEKTQRCTLHDARRAIAGCQRVVQIIQFIKQTDIGAISLHKGHKACSRASIGMLLQCR